MLECVWFSLSVYHLNVVKTCMRCFIYIFSMVRRVYFSFFELCFMYVKCFEAILPFYIYCI